MQQITIQQMQQIPIQFNEINYNESQSGTQDGNFEASFTDTFWREDVNLTYIRRSEDIFDVS